MPHRKIRFALLLFLFLVVCHAAEQDTFEGVERVVAIGDIHGDFNRLVELLRTAKLIDTGNAWSGGAAHLVMCGDMVDRGPASRQVLDLLMDLEPQAKKAGGEVHVLLGNHETMDIYGDLRYVSASDYQSYSSENSAKLRDNAFKQALDDLRSHGSPPPDVEKFRQTFEEQHPLGWVEFRLAFGSTGKYGKWLRQKNAVIRVNDLLFLHGGISPKYAKWTRAKINSRIREELEDFDKIPHGMVQDPEGPLWYRGLDQGPQSDDAMSTHIGHVLEVQQAKHIVVGHTVFPTIVPRFGARVITIDVGLSAVYGGPPAFLLEEGGKIYVMYRGTRVDFPASGVNPEAYFREEAALDPPGSPILRSLGALLR